MCKSYCIFFPKLGSVGGGSGDSLGSILAVMASISQGLFFSLIRYKYAKGQDVSDMDILCYNVVAAIGVCVGEICWSILSCHEYLHWVIIRLTLLVWKHHTRFTKCAYLSSSPFIGHSYLLSYSISFSFSRFESQFTRCRRDGDSVSCVGWCFCTGTSIVRIRSEIILNFSCEVSLLKSSDLVKYLLYVHLIKRPEVSAC